MSRCATWTCGLLWAIAPACSSADTHPPGANNDCPVGVKCDRPYGGISSSGGGNPPPKDAAASQADARTDAGVGCITDPTFGVTLCSGSPTCTRVRIDP